MKVTDALTRGLNPEMRTVRTSGTRVAPAGLRPLAVESAELTWAWRRGATLRTVGSTKLCLGEAAGFRKDRRSRGWFQATRQCLPQRQAM
jgi:hypothetical protein